MAVCQVLRLITRLNIGGPARQALLLTKDLAHQWPTILAAGSPGNREGELSDPAVEVRRLPLVRPVHPLNDLRALREVRRLLTRYRPRVVHTHMAKAGVIGRAAAVSHSQRPRTVHTFHGHVLEGYFNPVTQKAFLQVERQLARRTDVLIAVSPQIRDQLVDLGVGRVEQYRVVPLGFDLSRHLGVQAPSGTLRRAIELRSQIPLIGVVGRLVPIKDIGILLRSLARLPGVHLALLGDGDSRGDLEREASSLGVADRCHFVGWWNDVPAAMSDLDVVVLSSRNEGTPVSLIEALACARPVVATDVGGVRFVVRSGETGLLCTPGASDEMAQKIRLLLDNPARARSMGHVGRNDVRHRFHKDRLLAEVGEIYRELTSPAGA